jgi:Coenzyme PQQ synthesis protein D (PqqD)
MTARFAVDPRRVVHETIDGETILIALETGVYYSLSGSGPEIWDLVVAGWPAGEIVAEMERRHAAEPGARDATGDLLAELVSEKLVAEAAPNGDDRAPAAPAHGEFSTPVLKKYTDMEFFLQLDPIHEVDAAGWPHERSSA